MAGVDELIRTEQDKTLSFGNHTLQKKTKLSDYAHLGDIYKVKTFKDMTRLEKNDSFLYESEPGTTVYSFKEDETGVEFYLEAAGDVQLTLELKENTTYKICIGDALVGEMKTNLGGKLSVSVEVTANTPIKVSAVEA